jgi:hypothetical protein
VEVTCAFVWALLGENDLYDKLWALFKVLNCDYTDAIKGNFSAELCRHVVWAILEEMREFFNQVITPAEFKSGRRVNGELPGVNGQHNRNKTKICRGCEESEETHLPGGVAAYG